MDFLTVVASITDWRRLRAAHWNYSLGQSAWYAVNELCPEFVADITGTKLDPFYDDSRLGAFYKALYDHLENRAIHAD